MLVRMRGNGVVERGETNSTVLVILSENTLFKALWPNKLQGWYARINKESLVLLENIPVKKVRTTKLAIELYVIHCKHIGDWTTEILLGSIEIYLLLLLSLLLSLLLLVGLPCCRNLCLLIAHWMLRCGLAMLGATWCGFNN